MKIILWRKEMNQVNTTLQRAKMIKNKTHLSHNYKEIT